MTTETYPRSVRHHTGLAEIPKSWDKAYTSRKRRDWIARVALWGFVIAFAATLLLMAGRMLG